MASTYLALLRGVNVGGRNRVPMKELAELFAEVGCTNVRTFIQSGNVIFAASANLFGRLPESLPAGIHRKFGLQVPVVLRSRAEVAAVVAANPFVETPEGLYVAFLRDAPTPEQVAKLDPDRSLPDRFVVLGREVYLHLPTGAGNSKLTNAYLDSKLQTVSTARNWRTVSGLLEIMSQ